MEGNSDSSRSEARSFEVAEGDAFGDLLSSSQMDAGRRLKIGLLATGFFEYWSMYPSLKGLVEQDARVVCDRLSQKHDIVHSGLVDTIDAADAAGRRFRDEQVDLIILAYRTYVPDAYIH